MTGRPADPGLDADLATLRRFHTGERWLDKEADAAWPRVEAELARLREERDAAQREADIQMGEKLAAQVTLKAITDSLCLPLAELGNGWTEATTKILARIEEIVDEGERWFQEATRLRSDKDERDWRTLEIVTAQAQAAEAECARLRQALSGIHLSTDEPFTEMTAREALAESACTHEWVREHGSGESFCARCGAGPEREDTPADSQEDPA